MSDETRDIAIEVRTVVTTLSKEVVRQADKIERHVEDTASNLQELHDRQQEITGKHAATEQSLASKQAALEARVAALEVSDKVNTELVKSVQTTSRFIKWVGGVVAAVVTLVLAIKELLDK